jgi:hypothetical protein
VLAHVVAQFGRLPFGLVRVENVGFQPQPQARGRFAIPCRRCGGGEHAGDHGGVVARAPQGRRDKRAVGGRGGHRTGEIPAQLARPFITCRCDLLQRPGQCHVGQQRHGGLDADGRHGGAGILDQASGARCDAGPAEPLVDVSGDQSGLHEGGYIPRACGGSSVDLVTPVEEGADRQVRGTHREVGIAPAVQHLSVL